MDTQIDQETISVFSHQLRTNLAALQWLLQMFLDGDVGTLSPEQIGLLKKAASSNAQMITLVGELLDISKVHGVRPVESIDVEALVDDALFDFTAESYKRGIEVVFTRPDHPLPAVSAERIKLRFVIQNLIENALKYSESGSKVFIHIEEHDKMLTVSVKDTGIGIPEAERAHLFEKYFRATNAKQKESLGTGLGLYVSKRIIETAHGTLTCESNTHGTSFYLSLPTL